MPGSEPQPGPGWSLIAFGRRPLGLSHPKTRWTLVEDVSLGHRLIRQRWPVNQAHRSLSNPDRSTNRSLTSRGSACSVPPDLGRSNGAATLSSNHGGSGKRSDSSPDEGIASSRTRTRPGGNAGRVSSLTVPSDVSTPSTTTHEPIAIFIRTIAGTAPEDKTVENHIAFLLRGKTGAGSSPTMRRT